MENSKERLKALMLKVQTISGEKKLVCGSFTTSIQNNPPSVVLDEQYVENFPEKYIKRAEPEINKALLKDDLKAGVDLEGLAHLETTASLRIR